MKSGKEKAQNQSHDRTCPSIKVSHLHILLLVSVLRMLIFLNKLFVCNWKNKYVI